MLQNFVFLKADLTPNSQHNYLLTTGPHCIGLFWKVVSDLIVVKS